MSPITHDNQCHLRRCDLRQCEALCCHDGTYLLPGEEAWIHQAISEFPADFPDLPPQSIIDGERGRRTAVRPHLYRRPDFPPHFPATRCVFADAQGLCTLEKLARRLRIHPWTFKPTACWLFPLKVADDGTVIPPPVRAADDHDRRPDYPGFTAFATCGAHDPQGLPWRETLADEIINLRQSPGLPRWAARHRTVREEIDAQLANDENAE